MASRPNREKEFPTGSNACSTAVEIGYRLALDMLDVALRWWGDQRPSSIHEKSVTLKHAAHESSEPGWRSDPDVALMQRVRDGDSVAFRELFAKHGDAVVNFAYRFVNNRARAEELAQDAFLQIYRARRRYEAKARFSTYLYRVVTNLCLNELRRFDYHGKTESLEGKPLEDGTEGSRELADVDLPEAEDLLAGVEAGAKITKVLDKLPPNQKSALLLSRVEGLSYQEVAECLETTESAVKSLIFRATKTLREELDDLLR
jgi:RNA polymerase sigma-70 factor (ECF subfamily)